MPEIKFAKQPLKWKRSLVSMLQMTLQTFGPGFEQTGAKLQRHSLKMVGFFKRLGLNGLRELFGHYNMQI